MSHETCIANLISFSVRQTAHKNIFVSRRHSTARPLKSTTRQIANAKQAFSMPSTDVNNSTTIKLENEKENRNPTENFLEIIYGSGRNIPLNPDSYTVHIKKYFSSKLQEIYKEDFLEYSMGVINKDFLDNLHDGGAKKGNIFNSKSANNNSRSYGSRSFGSSSNKSGSTKEEKLKMEVKENQLQEFASEFRKSIHVSRIQPQNTMETVNQLSVKSKDGKPSSRPSSATSNRSANLNRNNSYNERNETKQLQNLTYSEAMDFMALINGIKPSDKKKNINNAKKSAKDNQSEYESEYENDDNPSVVSEWVKNFDLIEENGALLGLAWSKESEKITDLLSESIKNNKNFTRTSNKFILATVTYSCITNEVREIIPLILDPPDEISDTTGDWLKFFNRRKLKEFGNKGNTLDVQDGGLRPRSSIMTRPKLSTMKRN